MGEDSSQERLRSGLAELVAPEVPRVGMTVGLVSCTITDAHAPIVSLKLSQHRSVLLGHFYVEHGWGHADAAFPVEETGRPGYEGVHYCTGRQASWPLPWPADGS